MTDTDRDEIDNEIDWTRWEGETGLRYLLRSVSQLVWILGDKIGRAGFAVNQWVWTLSDWILDVAYPPTGPVEIDFGENDA